MASELLPVQLHILVVRPVHGLTDPCSPLKRGLGCLKVTEVT
jgi:hypothetical protein